MSGDYVFVMGEAARFLVGLAELFIFLPAVQYLMGEAFIFAGARRYLPDFFRRLFACPSCLGFWLGMVAGLLGVGPWGAECNLFSAGTWWGGMLLTGLAAVAITPIGRGLMSLGWAVAGGYEDDALGSEAVGGVEKGPKAEEVPRGDEEEA